MAPVGVVDTSKPPVQLEDNKGKVAYQDPPTRTTRARITEVKKFGPHHVYIGAGSRPHNLKQSKWAYNQPIRKDESPTAFYNRYRKYLLSQPKLRQALGELKNKILV